MAAVSLLGVTGCFLPLMPWATEYPGPWCLGVLWPLFALGLSLAMFGRAPRLAATVAATALVGLCVVDEHARFRGYAAAGLVTLGALVCIDRGGVPPLRARPMEAVGIVSYGLYLTHVPVMGFVGCLLAGPLSAAGATATFCVTLALQLAAAAILRRSFLAMWPSPHGAATRRDCS